MLHRTVIVGFFLLFLGFCRTYAYELDTSVDDVIRQKYNSTELSDKMLPQLPEHLKQNSVSNSANSNSGTTTSSNVPKTTPVFSNSSSPKINNQNVKLASGKTGVKIPQGTKFQAKSQSKATCWSGKNTAITFVTTAPVYKKGFSILSGTKLTGTVTNSRAPQITGNGGLLEIKVTKMIYKGREIPINGKITKVNSKLVFFNKIKGERAYLEGVNNQYKKGKNFYYKSRAASKKLASNPAGTLISPIPTIAGAVGCVVCTAASPVTGLTQKGKSVSIPAGSVFEIKLTEPAYL